MANQDRVTVNPNQKYFKDILINGQLSKAYVDFGSTLVVIKLSEVNRLSLSYDSSVKTLIKGYGNKTCVVALGKTSFSLSIDDVEAKVVADVVADSVQKIPVLVGHPFTELPGVLVVKDSEQLVITEGNINDIQLGVTKDSGNDISKIDSINSNKTKVVLYVKAPTLILKDHLVNISVIVRDNSFIGDLFVESSLPTKEGSEYFIPRTVISVNPDHEAVIPIISLADSDFTIKNKKPIIRAWPCVSHKESEFESVLRVESGKYPPLPIDDINVGPVSAQEHAELIKLLQNYRDCFSQSATNVGCAKSTQIEINLSEEKPFTYRPYRVSESQQKIIREMIEELLASGIIRESSSPYASLVLLVKKKNGEDRMRIDYRKLNAQTVKEQHPLPRIDDQLDRLHGSVYFTSLDLRSGYYQIPVEENLRKYTAFVTSEGQYEFNRMPFGLTNAPRVFQRFMNRILLRTKGFAAVYLDDVLFMQKQ